MACPGSWAATAGAPNVSSAAALEGTQAHELLEASLTNDVPAWRLAFERAPEDMRAAVSVARDYVYDLLREYPDAVLLVEQQFEIPIAAAPGEVFGTNDICLFVPSLRLLYVIDYKHGAGKYVEVKGNRQLRFYGLGALAAGQVAWPEMQFDTVALVIIQPRITWAAPIREEWISVEDLLQFGVEIGEAVLRAKAPDAPRIPGEEQCQWCAVKTNCRAREKAALSAVGEQFGDVRQVDALPDPKQLPNEKLAIALSKFDEFKSWIRDLEKEAAARMMGGEAIAGFKIVEAQARRVWEAEANEAAVALANISGGAPADFLVSELRGFGDVEAILKRDVSVGLKRADAVAAKKIAMERMSLLTTKKSSGTLTVVPETDPRPAVNRSETAFGGVAQIPHITQREIGIDT